MGQLCTSSKNSLKHANTYDNLDLIQLKDHKTHPPLFGQKSETHLNDLQKLTDIPITKFHSIIMSNKKIKPPSRDQLKTMSQKMKKIATPNKYDSNEYYENIKQQLRDKSLIELCDVSRHLYDICKDDIRVILLSVEIQRHFGCNDISVLHSTIKLLNDIGFQPPSNQSSTKTPKYTLFFSDLSYCDEIKWWLDFEILKRKPMINLSQLCDEFHIATYDDINKYIIDMFDYSCHNVNKSRGNICIKEKGKELLDEIDYLHGEKIHNKNVYMDRYEILIVGYFKIINYFGGNNAINIPNKIYKICQAYYHPPIDPHKNMTDLSYLSLVNNNFNLNILDMKNNKLFNNINIINIGINSTRDINGKNILFMVKNASIPYWITQQYKNELLNINNVSINRKDNDLLLLYVKAIEYDNYLIIIDNKYKNGYNFAIPSGTDIVSEMYSYSNTNILCIDDENEICDYNIELDEYNKFNINGCTYHDEIPPKSTQDSIGAGICTFGYNKMFKCGGLNIIKSQEKLEQNSLLGGKYAANNNMQYVYYDNSEIITLDHNTLTGKYIGGISSMNINKAYFSMLYSTELQRIIAGPGGQIPISTNIIEIYDIIKNKWNVINAKTNYCYKSVKSLNEINYKQSFLWNGFHNPFIINLCNGKDYTEFIDIREEKQWYINDKVNKYLKEWNKVSDGQLLI